MPVPWIPFSPQADRAPRLFSPRRARGSRVWTSSPAPCLRWPSQARRRLTSDVSKADREQLLPHPSRACRISGAGRPGTKPAVTCSPPSRATTIDSVSTRPSATSHPSRPSGKRAEPRVREIGGKITAEQPELASVADQPAVAHAPAQVASLHRAKDFLDLAT